MNAEARFRAVYPKATIEKQNTNGGRRYYLVRRTRGAHMYDGCGDTKSKAWKDAADALKPHTPNDH